MARKNHIRVWACLLAVAIVGTLHAQYTVVANGGGGNITGYTGSGGNVAIPSTFGIYTITGITSNAFGHNTNLTAITVPSTVTSIGDYAFYTCTLLTNVTVSNGLTTLGKGVFGYCTNLETVSLPGTVTSIGTQVFADCTNASILLDPSDTAYTFINGALFNSALTTLVEYSAGAVGGYNIPNGVTSVGDYAFFDCAGLTSVSIPGSVTSIGNYAFCNCLALTNVTMANGVENIGAAAFAGCTNLTNVVLPGTVTSIGSNAFDGCFGLASLTIAAGPTNLGPEAFADCSALASLAVPGSVTTIGTNAFEYCLGLNTAIVGRSVNNIGPHAFWDCSNLSSIYFGGNVPASLGASAFYPGNGVTAYYLPTATGWSGFSSLTGIPAILWNPGIVGGGADFGVQNGGFGFDITNTASLTVTVQGSSDLSNPNWMPLRTMTLTNGLAHFSEPWQGTNSFRFYGLAFP